MSKRVAVRRSVTGNGLLTGLVAYWPLNEASGDALDLHGGLTLTAVNAPGAAAGKLYATARSFAKASQQSFYRTSTEALRGGADLTFATWFYLTTDPGESPNYYLLFDAIVGATGWQVGLVHNAYLQLFGFAGYGGGYYDAAHCPKPPSAEGDPGTGVWAHGIFWYDHAAYTVWAQLNDLTPVSSAGPAAMLPESTYEGYHRLGATRAGTSKWLDGRLQGAAFWSRILTADERAALYNGGAGLAYAGFTA